MNYAACASGVHPTTMAAVVRVESGSNPLAIGVVGGRLARQPIDKAEAVATALALEKAGYNFSVGIGQINRYNLPKYGLSYAEAFEPCPNLRVGAEILKDCFARAKTQFKGEQQALDAAFSCYYSGNFRAGFQADFRGQPSYVAKVVGPVRLPTVAPIPSLQRSSTVWLVRTTAPTSNDETFVRERAGDPVMVYR